jgi:hypothetical protein
MYWEVNPNILFLSSSRDIAILGFTGDREELDVIVYSLEAIIGKY